MPVGLSTAEWLDRDARKKSRDNRGLPQLPGDTEGELTAARTADVDPAQVLSPDSVAHDTAALHTTPAEASQPRETGFNPYPDVSTASTYAPPPPPEPKPPLSTYAPASQPNLAQSQDTSGLSFQAIPPTIAGGAPKPPADNAPSFNEQAAGLARRRAFESDKVSADKRNLGETLMAILSTMGGQAGHGAHLVEAPTEESFANRETGLQKSAVAEYLARKRQQTEDEVGNKLKGAETEEKKAHAYQMLHPEVKPNEINPASMRATTAAAYKAELTKRPDLAKQLANAGTKEEFDAIRSTLEGDRNHANSLENSTILATGSVNAAKAAAATAHANKLSDLPVEARIQVAKAVTEKVNDERSKINTVKGQLDQVEAAFTKASGVEAIISHFGVDSPQMKDFKASALAAVDKMAQVETGGAGRQAQIAQWKAVIENVVTDSQLKGVMHGLRGAIAEAEAANEGRLKDLPDVGGTPAPGPATAKPTKTLRNPKTGKTIEVDG